ncbi:MAG: hypothetical protein ACFFE8_02305 [Candidatus Heimdallarchaeota archaeon]
MIKDYVAIPKKLRTIQAPGKKIKLWINDRPISRLLDLPTNERPFVRDFIRNMEDLGWKVLVKD